MRIGIDISQVVYEGTGVSRFTKGLLDTILQYEKKNEWMFFLSSLRKQVDPAITKAIKDKNFTLLRLYFPPSLLSSLWNDFHKVEIEKFIGNVDWFITSDWTEPPSRSKKATIVHDLTFKRYPETVDPVIQRTQENRLSWIVKESSVIFADSVSTRDDLINIMSCKKEKVVVNYPGVITRTQSNEYINLTLKKYNLNKPFILSVGKMEPRKNLKRLIQAFDETKEDIDLAIVGPPGWDHETREQNQSNNRVRWLGYVSDDELFALYQSSLFFVFPSIWEGFGYPAVEAMQLGCPCALSNTSSLAEIGKDTALLFDPWKTESIKNALEKMIHDETLRKNLAANGLKKAASFTWKRYFDTMMESLSKTR